MSDFGWTPLTCSVCGRESRHKFRGYHCCVCLGFGPELDTRSRGHATGLPVQMCPSCGYCSEDISRTIPGASTVVTSRAYREQLKGASTSGKANALMCHAMILENAGDFAAAGWASLRAAWAFDDEVIGHESEVMGRVRTTGGAIGFSLVEMLRWATLGRVDLRIPMKDRHNQRALSAARRCREAAAGHFQRAIDSGQTIVRQTRDEDAIDEDALVVDILRRSGRFEDALSRCRSGLDRSSDPKSRRILEFESALIGRRDVGRHWLDEVTRRKP